MLTTRTVTIANGASLSDAAGPMDGFRLVGIVMPSSWTAANITFEASIDGVTYGALVWSGTELACISPAASRYVVPVGTNSSEGYGLFPPVRYLKCRSGSVGGATNQGAQRVLTLVFEAIYPQAWGTRGQTT